MPGELAMRERGLADSPQDHAQPNEPVPDQPVTLHRVMQTMIAEGLRERYKPPQKLSHQLFVVMMQLNELDRRERRRQPINSLDVHQG